MGPRLGRPAQPLPVYLTWNKLSYEQLFSTEYKMYAVGNFFQCFEKSKFVYASIKYLLLTEFEGLTVNYNPHFSPSIYGPSKKHAEFKSKGKNKGP